MPAEFVGLKNIVKNLNRFDFDGLAVYKGKDAIFIRHCDNDEDKSALIEAFEDWAEDMLNGNPNNSNIYNIQLYEYPNGASKRRGSVRFSFQLTEQLASNYKKKEANDMLNGEYVHKDTMLLAIENANLKNQLEALNDRLNALETCEEEEDEEEDESFVGALQESLKDKMPQLIDFVLGALTPKTQIQTTGIGSNIDEIISEFREINPNIESDLHKLLQLAKTKPDLFKMLITQLRSM